MTSTPPTRPPRRLERGDGFVARTATAADLPQMLQVLQGTFPTWPPVPSDRSALEYLEWKTNPPGRGPVDHGVVEFHGRLVAVKLRWFGRAWLRGTAQTIDAGSDMAVLDEFQGRGIGRFINALEEHGDRHGGTISVERPSRHAAVRHMEVEHEIFNGRVWIRPLDLRTTLSVHRRIGVPSFIGATVRGLRPPPLPSGGTLREIDRFDERVDELWLAGRHRFDLARIRDAAELNWRYADPRGGRCTRIGAFEDNQILAYAVYRVSEDELLLLDLLTHPDRPDAARAVLRAGVALGRRERLRRLVAWVIPGHHDEPIYEAAGFVPGEEFPLAWKIPRGSTAPEVQAHLYDPTLRRYLTIGDFDFT